MKRLSRKSIAFITVLILLLASAITVFAVNYIKATESSGSYTRKIINRVAFTFSDTEQKFQSNLDGTQCVFTATLSAKKNEADFYAVIHSISVSGMEYDKIVVSPVSKYDAVIDADDSPLPVINGEPAEVGWSVQVFFTPDSYSVLTPTLEVEYTSGVKIETADKHILEIPLKITVTE